MFFFQVVAMGLVAIGAMAYIPSGKEHFLTDALLREVVDRLGNDLSEAADAYLDFPDSTGGGRMPVLGARSHKDMEMEEPLFPVEYESIGDANPNPSIRDQEYMEHSTLWGNQYMSGGAGEGKQRLKPEGTIKNHQEVKTDATLPAYCNPPNPCPIGYAETQGCTLDFENTAAFSRRYQAAQDCMCDSEHMFDCPSREEQVRSNNLDSLSDLDFNRFLQRTMQNNEQNAHKSLVAKKYHMQKSLNNPFLYGERLPVAAKKGINVVY